jgi:hypothetical protein
MIDLLFIEAIPRPNGSILWISIVVLFSLLAIAYVKQRNDSISVSVNSFFNLRFFRQSIREETNASLKYSRILLLNSFVVVAVVLNYFLGKDIVRHIKGDNMIILLLLFFVVMFWYILDMGLKKLVGSISNTKSIELEHQRYNQYFFQTLGLFLLPGVIGLYFFPSNLLGVDVVFLVETYIKLAVIVLVLNKVTQSILQSFEIKISWVYIFLYICTLEILPLCVGFQVLVY